jgi:hypothetical protein
MAVRNVGGMFGEIIGLVFLVALIPIAYTFIDSANITDATVSLLIGLTPLVLVLAYLYGMAKRHGFA